LLSSQDINGVKDKDLQILDDLISILRNTGNLFAENCESIINLQEGIRSRIYQWLIQYIHLTNQGSKGASRRDRLTVVPAW